MPAATVAGGASDPNSKIAGPKSRTWKNHMWENVTAERSTTLEMLELDGASLSLNAVREVAVLGRPVRLHTRAVEAVERSHEQLQELLSSDQALYGINTGFGELASRRIGTEDLATLQRNLVLSHAVGVGPALSAAQVRAIVLLRANSLARGASGVRRRVLDALLDLLRARVVPVVPAQGSVGSSGDLAPLAHLALGMMGVGDVLVGEGPGTVPARDALQRAGLEPLELQAKEGLALLNGTQPMAALGIEALLRGELCARTADVIGALSLQPLMGTDRAFDRRLMELRPHPGALASARNLRVLLEGSPMIEYHRSCNRVQDAYSLRAMPVVHGASRDAMREARRVLEIEINSVTDNPLIVEGTSLSGANFHGQPVAVALDYLAIGLAELGSIAERRIERLVNPHYNEELPAFLVRGNGLNSGFMVPQYTAAALVSENKILASPASVDSIPTSAGKEDHVSMGTIAARKALRIAVHLEHILAIEFLCAAQAADLRAPLELSGPTRSAYELLRAEVPSLEADRWLQPDILQARRLIATGQVLAAAEKHTGPLE
jgi:histidine ammonia-lyase